jgi:hypothetical protein
MENQMDGSCRTHGRYEKCKQVSAETPERTIRRWEDNMNMDLQEKGVKM